MSEPSARQIPENHPIRSLFWTVTERGLGQINIRDAASLEYVSGLLLDFIRLEELYRVRDARGQRVEYLSDLLELAEGTTDPFERLDQHKHLGDHSLFMLGLFPERFERSRRPISAKFYAEQGQRSYGIVADLAWIQSESAPFRRLAKSFDQYVRGLNWVKLYLQDPFFQYMFKEFHVT
jgi:hypothetical protein